MTSGKVEFHPHELLQKGNGEGGWTEQVAPTDELQVNRNVVNAPRGGIVGIESKFKFYKATGC